MEDMASLWSYQQTVDELRQKLLYTNVELEELKADKNDEMKKNKEYVKQLIQMLKIVCEERDEARVQIQKLLNKIDSIVMINSTKANSSSITDQYSNSLSSETYNYHNSSPNIDSFFDSVASPECSNNMAYDHNVDSCVTQLAPKVELIIENLVKGKTLPQQGKLLQAVVETGPILQTLLVSGPTSSMAKSTSVQVSIKGCQSDSYLSHPEDSTSLHISQQMLHFANFESGFCLENHSLMSAGKSQRLY
ncbi:uncharacterized protein [Solanum tuberosum]|uniref:UPA23 n=1 Tax=Solanum tuberosum TaxID=4113 RepID=M1B9J3_SOLTU|nr:PREDICTED: uncharacterized protein LOC102595625 [Solanum tuberosum]